MWIYWYLNVVYIYKNYGIFIWFLIYIGFERGNVEVIVNSRDFINIIYKLFFVYFIILIVKYLWCKFMKFFMYEVI